MGSTEVVPGKLGRAPGPGHCRPTILTLRTRGGPGTALQILFPSPPVSHCGQHLRGPLPHLSSWRWEEREAGPFPVPCRAVQMPTLGPVALPA